MIKVDIVNEVSKIADITKVKAEVAVDAVFDAMRTSMQRGERIELRGFGVFQVKPRKRGLGCHELGHYFACRYYDVDASLPFFLPIPISITGTLGAFIRIREPIPQKRMLFDIGIAGPIAGFLIAVPALFIGLSLSRVVPVP